MPDIACIDLDCGATLVAEPLSNVASAAVTWLLPMGTSYDPPEGDGESVLLSEMIFRGAGGMTSREHSDALDMLGTQRSSAASTHHLRISATMLGDRVDDALPLLTMMVREPALPEDALPAVRSLALQALDSLDDDPQHVVMLNLHGRHQPTPFNRTGYGERSVLESASIGQLREAWATRCHPRGCIIAAAGRIDVDAIARRLDGLLSDWTGEHSEPVELEPPRRGVVHTDQDTAQVHLGLAYAAPPEPAADSMLERLGVGVLSGGTSARLFTEVRQKRSLVYTVGASYAAGRERGAVTLYAGTTPERAQETLDVCGEQIRGLADGVTAEEFDRATIGIKSHLIMQGESTAARASAIAQDTFRLGRPRTLGELAATIDAISVDDLNAYLSRRDFGTFTVATIGPASIQAEALV
jgi:predicted Zn-dependent peptidase